MDLTTLEIGNARERDLDKWKSLFTKAGHHFKFQSSKQSPGPILTLIEAICEG
jgi:hypothetical protein